MDRMAMHLQIGECYRVRELNVKVKENVKVKGNDKVKGNVKVKGNTI